MKLPSPWSSPRGSLSVKSALPEAGGAARTARRRAAAVGEREARSMYVPKESGRQKGPAGSASRRASERVVRESGLEADLHERLEAVLPEVPLLQAVPAAEAAAEAQRSDRHAEVRG